LKIRNHKIGFGKSLSLVGLLVGIAFGVCCSKPAQHKPAPATPPPANSQTLTGRVVSIADGDTVTVLDADNVQHRIRLSGIDAPESHQAFGTRSKQNLSELVFGNDVTVTYDKTDQYGRLVGKIVFAGNDVNLMQVKEGMAWHYKEYEREQTPEDRELYARAEEEARAQHLGLWQDSNPIEPSQFRREQREERRGKSATGQ
jgi:endonuclease YncB( thermonuclease family)